MATELRKLVDRARTVQEKAESYYTQAEAYAASADAAEAAGNETLANSYLVMADQASANGDNAIAELAKLNDQIFELTGNTIDPDTGDVREGHPDKGIVRPDTIRGELERRGVDTIDIDDADLGDVRGVTREQEAAQRESDARQAEKEYLDELAQKAHNVNFEDLPVELRDQVVQDDAAEKTGAKDLIEKQTGWNYEDLSPAQRADALEEAAADQSGAKAAVEGAAGAAWSDLTDAQRAAAMRNVAFNAEHDENTPSSDEAEATPDPTPADVAVTTPVEAATTPDVDAETDVAADSPPNEPAPDSPAPERPANEAPGPDIENETVITAGEGQAVLLAPYLTLRTSDGSMYNYEDGVWVDEYGEVWYVADANGNPVLVGTPEGDALLAEHEAGGESGSEGDTGASTGDGSSDSDGDGDGDGDDEQDPPPEEETATSEDASADEGGDPDGPADSTPHPDGDDADPRKAAEFKASPIGAESAARDEQAIEMAVGGGLRGPREPESRPVTTEEVKLAEQAMDAGRGGGHTDPVEDDSKTSVGQLDEVRARGGGVVDPPETAGDGKGGDDPLGGDGTPPEPPTGTDDTAFGAGDTSIIIGSKGGPPDPEPDDPDGPDGGDDSLAAVPDVSADDLPAGMDLHSDLLREVELQVHIDTDQIDLEE